MEITSLSSTTSAAAATKLACPKCHASHAQGAGACGACGQAFFSSGEWLDLCLTANEVNDNTQAAYEHYSRLYAPIALLAYLIVWRGNFPRHVKFFREILNYGTDIVDVATGDASLTSLALFKGKTRASSCLAIDISGAMLRKAKRKLPAGRHQLVRGDALQLPLADASVPVLSCFGGFNSFPDGGAAMKELARVLASNGVIRGSVLLMPKTPWREKTVLNWISKGYQTEVVTEEKFLNWIRAADLMTTAFERHGDVILFELKHSRQ